MIYLTFFFLSNSKIHVLIPVLKYIYITTRILHTAPWIVFYVRKFYTGILEKYITGKVTISHTLLGEIIRSNVQQLR